ncbi:MAG: tyrosine-type recombinase/integrase [Candidatus Riflebacteria bacterium]|nr:tyrosine-type recombinase/integrase [Candidatus Riflebacteria bacterium]
MTDLIASPDTATLLGRRDRAILVVLADTGVRARELCCLRIRDVSPTLAFIRNGKGGKQRFVPLSSRAVHAIKTYLDSHPARPDLPLFRRLEGGALDRRLLHKIVSAYQRRLRLKTGVHLLRASCAKCLLNRGLNLQTVRAILGHESIVTTGVYLGVATDQLVREYRAAVDQTPMGGEAR